MEFVGNIVDFGTAPEIHISDIARIVLVSTNTVRMTCTLRHDGPEETSKPENRVQVHILFDRTDWERYEQISQAARVALEGAPHEKLFLKPTPRPAH